jgi:molecular chaperone GrpE
MTEARKVKVTTPEHEEVALHAPPQRDAAAEPPRVEFSVQELADKLSAKEKECEELRDRMLRVSADFENYKKRAAREGEEFRRYANQSLLKEMLSAVDHIELAIQSAESAPETNASLVDGLRLTLKELLRIFDKFDVSPIAAVGKPFNPEFHEAIMREEGSALPENTVCREMQKGYLIGNRLLRPSLVVVAAPTGPGASPEANTDV